MPAPAHRALAFILVAKLLGGDKSRPARAVYSSYIKTREIREQALVNKKSRGRKVISTAQGKFFDLDEIFDKLNAEYFRKTLPKPVLSWSARKTYRILGHHDARRTKRSSSAIARRPRGARIRRRIRRLSRNAPYLSPDRTPRRPTLQSARRSFAATSANFAILRRPKAGSSETSKISNERPENEFRCGPGGK